MTKRRLSIAIPASVVSDTPHLREKTAKVGLIGRAAAIFRVEEILIYLDNPRINQTEDAALVNTLLTYMETPQYLRKRLFELRPELQYVGVLPPLRTPHHPLCYKAEDLKVGEYRDGVAVSKTSDGNLVDIGVEKPALLTSNNVPIGKRVTVKIAGVADKVQVSLANREDANDYWGYVVNIEKLSIGRLAVGQRFDLVVGTSRYGVPFKEVANEIGNRWQAARNILVVFGAPSRGLKEIVRSENLKLEDVTDFIVNIVPGQGTETVRTEEALIACLAIMNVHFSV